MATLSVCLIVRDEEQVLSRCLDSVQALADEIVIVDTGSADRTVAIARRYTDKVFFHPWNNDFSEARNVALDYATRDWVLQIDADEVLEQEDVPLVRQVIEGEGYSAAYVALYNVLPDGFSRHYYPRLFRREKAHYEGTVHNQLIYDGPAIITEIRIHHEGYNLSREAMVRKYRRTEALLQRHLQHHPDDLTAAAQLVRVYREWGRFDEVLQRTPAILGRCSPESNHQAHHMLVSDLAYTLMQKGRLDEGIAICREGLIAHPRSLDLWFTLAGLYFRKGNFNRAAESLHRFLELHDQAKRQTTPSLLMMGTLGKEAQAWQNLGACYEALDRPDEAVAAYAQACALSPEQPEYLMALGRLFLRQNRAEEAAVSLYRAVTLLEGHLATHSDDPEGMTKLATCYLLLGRPEAARLGFQAALALDPAFPPARKGLALL